MNDGSEFQISPNVVPILTNPPSKNVPVQGDLLRSHNRRFGNLPEDIHVRSYEYAGFVRKISRGQHPTTVHDTELTGFGHAGSSQENIRHLEMMKGPRRKDGFEETRKLAQY